MKTYIKIIVFILVYLFIFLFIFPAQAQQIKPCANIIGINGTVYIQKHGSSSWEKAEEKTPLFLNSKIKTDTNSYCAILFNDGSQVKINELTVIVIKNNPKDKQKKGIFGLIKVLLGEVWVDIKPQKEKEIFIETPCIKAVVKGTQFNLKVEKNGNVTLTVVKGLVKFKNISGEAMVSSSEQSHAEFDKKPSKPVKVNVDNIIKWTENIRVFTSLKIDAQKDKQYYIKAISKNTNSVEDRLALSYLYIIENDFTDAQKQLNYIINKIDPKNTDALIALGIIDLSCQKIKNAKYMFKKALQINPSSLAARQNLGFIYEAEGNYTAALNEYKKILQTKPEEYQVLINMGYLLYKTGDTQSAIDVLQKAALSTDAREKASAYFNLAKIYDENKNYNDALSNIKISLTLVPDDYSYKYLAQKIYLDTAQQFLDTDEIKAVNILYDALRTLPDNYEILSALGRIYLQGKNYPQAFAVYGKILKNDPYDGFACFYMGTIYELHFKNTAKAYEYYKNALKYFEIGDSKNTEIYNQIKKLLHKTKGFSFACGTQAWLSGAWIKNENF